MYNKQEKSVLRQQFWTAFGQYMAPIPSSEGIKINWVNYKTGIKDLYFKIDVGDTTASVTILMTHTDITKQTIMFSLFKQMQQVLHGALQEEWQWSPQMVDEYGKTVSAIYTAISGVSIYKREDWPLIISFFKPHMIALDTFWNEVKFGFDI